VGEFAWRKEVVSTDSCEKQQCLGTSGFAGKPIAHGQGEKLEGDE